MAGKIASWVIGLIITALYASTVVAAVGNIIGVPSMAEAIGLGISGTGWFWLWLGVVLPVVVFGIALLFGRGRRAAARVLILGTGLCVLAAVQLEILHLVPQSSFFI